MYCSSVCPPILAKHKFEFDDAKINIMINFLKFQDLNGIIFEIYGGEPTLYPGLAKLINKMRNEFDNIIIKVYSNMSMPLNKLKKLPKTFKWKISYHPHFYKNDIVKINKFLDNLEYINNNYKNTMFFQLVDGNNTEYLKSFYNEYIKRFPNNLENFSEIDFHSILDFNRSDVDYNLFTEEKRNRKNDVSFLNNIRKMDGIIEYKTIPEYDFLKEKDGYNWCNYDKFFGMMCVPYFWIRTDGSVEAACKQSGKYNINKLEKIPFGSLCMKKQCPQYMIRFPKVSMKKYLEIHTKEDIYVKT